MTGDRDLEGSGPVLGAVRQRVLDAAMREREPRQSTLAVDVITPVEAFRRTARDLDDLLRSLSAADWKQQALRDLDVQGLVGHLIGVERHAFRCLSEPDAGLAAADHVTSTDQIAAAQAGRRPEATRAEWSAAVEQTVELASGIGDLASRRIAIHGLQLPVSAFLVVRSFELWTHDNDIRRATCREPSRPDSATLQLMTALAAQMVPVGVVRTTGSAIPDPIRLVLTGEGGGVWELGAVDNRDAVARIVIDAVAFCRLVAHRVAPTDLVMDVWGDRQLIDTVLHGASSLALD